MGRAEGVATIQPVDARPDEGAKMPIQRQFELEPCREREVTVRIDPGVVGVVRHDMTVAQLHGQMHSPVQGQSPPAIGAVEDAWEAMDDVLEDLAPIPSGRAYFGLATDSKRGKVKEVEVDIKKPKKTKKK